MRILQVFSTNFCGWKNEAKTEASPENGIALCSVCNVCLVKALSLAPFLLVARGS